MKFLKTYSLFFLAMAMLFSCGKDPELGPIITVDTAEIGAFPRLVSLISGEFDLANPSSSSYSHEVEFQSEDAGLNVQTYEVLFRFVDNDPSNGDMSTEEALYESYDASQFGDSALGLKNITVSYPFEEAATKAGIDITAISPGDVFRYSSKITLSDGRVFSSANTESTIISDAFRAYFDWNVNATCPLPDNLFVGEYSISFLEGPGNPWATGLRAENVTLQLVPGSTTKRQFDAVVIDAFGGFPITATIDFVCTTVSWLTVGPGVGCAPPNILYETASALPQDITNDATITFEYFENGGGCAYENTDRVMLTKI